MVSLYQNYLVKKTKNLPLPTRLWIEPTSFCNLKCIMCPNKELSRKDKGFMEFSLFKKIIDEISFFAHDVNLFHRGESLLHPQIFKMIKYAKNKGLSTRLNTNATLLDEKRSYEIFNSGLDFLSFSFDGYEKKTYEKIRVGADFEKTLDNIINFLLIKKKLGKNSPYVTFTVIEFSEDSSIRAKKDVKEQFIKKFNSLPLDHFVIRSPHNWSGAYNTEEMTSNKSFCCCTFPWYSLTVFWDGSVLPCPQDFFGKLILGNVKDSSLEDIWNGSREIFLREKLSKRNYQDIIPCNNCDRLWRKKLFGLPLAEISRFLKDNVLGYKKTIRKILK